jgi:beta-aspartyl-peptidase (threonine type)
MTTRNPVPILAIHGGAGTLLRSAMSAEQAAQYEAALHAVLQSGEALLASGASALDVVTEAVRQLEECPLFNAGKGAVYTADATHELDACVMDGRDLAAGAVAGVSRVRNPVRAARALLETSRRDAGPVMLIGPPAEAFAAAQGLESVAPDWYGTEARYQQLLKARQKLAQGGGGGQALLDHDGAALQAASGPLDDETKFGTVGAVALDAQGHLAAATSTGGMTNKRPGRVGDSPLIGAGCYANDATVAVSCTGSGEMFMRAVTAYDVSALMEYAGLSLADATRKVVMDKLPRIDGRGGLIAVSRDGEVSLAFNTEGMYRGSVRAGEAPVVAIYAEGGA